MSDLKPQLTMSAGPVPGSIYYLDKPEIYMGRDLANEIPVPDAEISRRHARVFMQGNLVFIEDLGSTNGTFVNGMRISSPKELHHGDQITLAEQTVFAYAYPVTAEAMQIEQATVPADQPTVVPQVQESYHPVARPVPERELAPEPEFTKKPKRMSGFLIFLIILVAILVLAGLVLVFMPESWWCAITFNGLSGCPVR